MRRGCGRRRSGGRGQGDVVAERLELADVVAGLAVVVDAAGVVVGAEVVEAGGGVGQQVPDDDQDAAGDGGQGLELADAPDQAAVARAEGGVGRGGRGGDLAEYALEVGVAVAGGARAALGAGLDVRGARRAHDTRCAAVGNWPMSSPSSAMMTWAALLPMPGTSSRRASADSGIRAEGWWVSLPAAAPSPPPPVGSAPLPGAWAAGMAPISSSMRLVSWSIWPPRVSICASRILASS